MSDVITTSTQNCKTTVFLAMFDKQLFGCVFHQKSFWVGSGGWLFDLAKNYSRCMVNWLFLIAFYPPKSNMLKVNLSNFLWLIIWELAFWLTWETRNFTKHFFLEIADANRRLPNGATVWLTLYFKLLTVYYWPGCLEGSWVGRIKLSIITNNQRNHIFFNC